jgi:hypothetical protein
MTTTNPSTNPVAGHGPVESGGPKAIIYVTAEGLPDAWVTNQNEVEVHLTEPDSAVEAVIVLTLAEARNWVAELADAVTVACQEHVDGAAPNPDSVPVRAPVPGRVGVDSSADCRLEPDPLTVRFDVEDGRSCSSSLGSSG